MAESRSASGTYGLQPADEPCRFSAWSRDGKVLFYHSHENNKLMSTDPIAADPAGTAKEIMDMGSEYPSICGATRQIAVAADDRLTVTGCGADKSVRTWPFQQSRTLVAGWSPDGKQLEITGDDPQGEPRNAAGIATRRAGWSTDRSR